MQHAPPTPTPTPMPTLAASLRSASARVGSGVGVPSWPVLVVVNVAGATVVSAVAVDSGFGDTAVSVGRAMADSEGPGPDVILNRGDRILWAVCSLCLEARPSDMQRKKTFDSLRSKS